MRPTTEKITPLDAARRRRQALAADQALLLEGEARLEDALTWLEDAAPSPAGRRSTACDVRYGLEVVRHALARVERELGVSR